MLVPSLTEGRDAGDPEIRALRFDVIRQRAAQKLGMDPADVKNHHLAELFQVSLKSISRFRNRRIEPSLDTAMRISEILDLPIEDITERAHRAGVR